MTDLTATVSLNGVASFQYDDTRGLLYLTTTAGQFEVWNPLTCAFVGSVTLGGAPGGFALTPDGRYAIVGEASATSANTDAVDRIDLSTLTGQRLTLTVQPGTAEGVGHIGINQSGKAVFSGVFSYYDWQGNAVQQFDPEAATLQSQYIAGPSLGVRPGQQVITAPGTDLVFLKENFNLYGTLEALNPVTNSYTTTSYTYAGDPFGGASVPYGPVFGQDAISVTAGLFVDLAYANIQVYDFSLHQVANLTSQIAFASAAQFSADGHQLFLWNGSNVYVYDTQTWTQVGALSDPNVSATYGALVDMTASGDGRFLFLGGSYAFGQNGYSATGFQQIDLAAELHLTVRGDGVHTHLYGGIGDDLIISSAASETIDGGGGLNTVSYANASWGVTVRLALQGQGQNTFGGGTDTLLNFQNVIGSAFADTLEGGGSSSTTLTGGLGADTFVYRSGDGAVTVTDFSHAQGDKIDLSQLGAFFSLSDLLAHSSQAGSDTVIALSAGSLTLQGVSMTSLTAADFKFYLTTVGPGIGGTPTTGPGTMIGWPGDDWLLGGGGNDTLRGGPGSDYLDGGAGLNTAIYDGVYRQYTVGPGAATISDGPEGGSDILANIQRVQFIDGYLATGTTDTAGQVYRIYEATLGRGPDPVGLANWVHSLNSGTSLQTVINGFVNSTEFQQVYGALDNPAFVTLLYNNVLHRAPDTAGLNNWVALLNSGHSRAEVVTGFSESAEDIAALAAPVQQGLWIQDAAAAEAARLYDTVLGRLPDAVGLANWTHTLENGTSLQTVANGFVGSNEFQTTYGALDNPGFVTLLYRNVLHRAPDTAGLNNWVGQLTSGHSRAEVVLGFSESPEHIANTAPHVDYGVWLAG